MLGWHAPSRPIALVPITALLAAVGVQGWTLAQHDPSQAASYPPLTMRIGDLEFTLLELVTGVSAKNISSRTGPLQRPAPGEEPAAVATFRIAANGKPALRDLDGGHLVDITISNSAAKSFSEAGNLTSTGTQAAYTERFYLRPAFPPDEPVKVSAWWEPTRFAHFRPDELWTIPGFPLRSRGQGAGRSGMTRQHPLTTTRQGLKLELWTQPGTIGQARAGRLTVVPTTDVHVRVSPNPEDTVLIFVRAIDDRGRTKYSLAESSQIGGSGQPTEYRSQYQVPPDAKQFTLTMALGKRHLLEFLTKARHP